MNSRILRGSALAVLAAIFSVSGFFISTAYADSPAVLGVTQITSIQTFASPDGVFADGWKWVFDVTVPTNETVLQMKFADWSSLLGSIPAGGNVEFYSSQSTNATSSDSAIVIATSSAYSAPLYLDPSADLDVQQGGRQIQVTVEARVPAGSPTGSFSTSYGIQTTIPQVITFPSIGDQVYGAAPFAPYASTTSGLPVTLSIVSGPATTDGTNITLTGAGPVTVEADQAGNSTYFMAASVDQTFNVDQAPLTIKADDQTRAYGADNPPLTASYIGFVNGDGTSTLTTQAVITTSAATTSPIGDYDITVSGATAANYDITFTTGTLAVTPAAAMVSIDPASLAQTYDGSPEGVTVTTVPPGLSLLVTYNGSGMVPTDADSYDVMAAISDPNYSGFAEGTLVISPAPASVTATGHDKVYDGTTAATTDLTVNGVLGTDTVTAQGTAAFDTADVGTGKTVTVTGITLTGAQAPDYILTNSSTTTTADITAAPLTITPDDQTKVYGTANPALTTSYAGLVDSQTAAAACTTLPALATADASSSVGTYPITASGAVCPDYDVTYTAGALTVIPAVAVVDIDLASLDQTYDGAPESVTVTTIPVGLSTYVTYNGATTSPTVAGTYTAVATVTDPDYAGVATSTFTIAQVPVTVSAAGTNKIYDGTTAATTDLTVNGVLGTDTVTAQGTAAFDTADVGTGKTVTVTGITLTGAQAPDYILTNSSTTTTADITAAPLTITPDDQTKVYGTANPALTTSYAGLVDSQTAAAACTTLPALATADASSSVGTYPITASGAVCPDYDVAYGTGTLTVIQAQAQVILSIFEQTYDGTPHSIGVITVPPTLKFMTGTYDGSSDLPVDAGSYQVIVTIDDQNYFGSATGTLTIDPALVTVSAAGNNKTYDGTDAATADLTVHGAIGSDTLTATGNASFSDPAVGTGKTVTVTGIVLGGTDPGNYTTGSETSTTTTADIDPAALTITPDNATKVYLAPNPTFSFGYSGFVDNETSAVCSVLPAALTTADASSSVGTYPITASGAVCPDYTVSYAPGTLTITQATPVITWDLSSDISAEPDGTISTTQVDDTTQSVPGDFVFTSDHGPLPVTVNSGETLNITTTFNPTDTLDYASVVRTAQITVN